MKRARTEPEAESSEKSIIAQFKNDAGDSVGPQLELPLNSTPLQMEEVVNVLLEVNNVCQSNPASI